MKNKKLAISFIIIMILLMGCIYIVFTKNNLPDSVTLEKLTNVNFNKISYVIINGAIEQNQRLTSKEFISLFKDVKFKISNIFRIGSTAHISYVCYDEKGIALYTIVDIGNRGLYYIGPGKFEGNNRKEFKLYEILNK